MSFVNFVAEVSSNHANDLNRCRQFIRTAKDIGCDSVKFQLFKIDELFHKIHLERYPQIQARRAWELNLDYIPIIAEECKKAGLQFSCTPFYLKAVDELRPYVDFFKIASYELLWLELFEKCSGTGLPLVFSTGMADLKEVENALKTIAKGKTRDVTILQCTSAYPSPPDEANLNAIDTMRAYFKDRFPVLNIQYGYSDHTVRKGVVHRAIHKHDARMIEFHIDLDGTGDEFRSGHCWLPDQMKILIAEVQDGLVADGKPEKHHTPAEAEERMYRADPSDGLRPLLVKR